MSTVQKLIDDIRDTLNDPNADRWSNARLIRGINEAMLDINLVAKLLRSQLSFNIQAGVHTYQLPDYVQLVTRCIYNRRVLFKSHDEMDELNFAWTETTGQDKLDYVVYDKLNRGEIRLYPIPESNINAVQPALGVSTTISGFDFNSPFGVMVGYSEELETIVIYYIKKPTKVTDVTDTLELNDLWDKAIKHYVCGITLRDDNDSQNRAFGNEELALYAGELSKAQIASESDASQTIQYQTPYRTGV